MADSKLIWASTRPSDGGVFFRAPLGTALPVMDDAPWDSLDAAWEDHGWMGDAGVTNSIKRDRTEHQAFGGQIVKVTQDKYTETIKVTCYESSEVVLKTVFGDENVTVDETSGHRQITVNHVSDPLGRSAFLARVVDGDKTRLIRCQEGEVITIEDIVHVHSDLVKYTIVVMGYKPDAETPAFTELIDEADVLVGS
ncbi:phage tail tube protein [Mycobacterium marinum]|uniref:phage tail tube protein n=1 Tax=Mycobacterium marinum TaxID=1781 RepID=UPI000B96F120|nr:hypothetical protein [Mycobacterium marinum]